MKLLIASILFVLPIPSLAECSKEIEHVNVGVQIEINSEKVKAGGEHGSMDEVTISTPAAIEGIPLLSMELTAGEVASFWVPVAFKINNGIATTAIRGYKESIKDFEILINFADSQCHKSVQRSINAYNQ